MGVDWRTRTAGLQFRRRTLQDTRLSMRRLPVILAATVAGALGWSADWLTDGGNSQRTAWQRDEKILSTDSVRNMKLLWKLKLDNEPRQMHSLFPPLIIGRVSTSSGPKQIAIEAGVSDNIYAID